MNPSPTSPPKWTREPWSIHWNAIGQLCIYSRKQIVCKFSEGIDECLEHEKNKEANSQRIVKCVNALAGIQSPEDFVSEVREVLKELQWSGVAENDFGSWRCCPVCENKSKHAEDCRLGRLLSLLNGERKDER